MSKHSSRAPKKRPYGLREIIHDAAAIAGILSAALSLRPGPDVRITIVDSSSGAVKELQIGPNEKARLEKFAFSPAAKGHAESAVETAFSVLSRHSEPGTPGYYNITRPDAAASQQDTRDYNDLRLKWTAVESTLNENDRKYLLSTLEAMKQSAKGPIKKS